MCKRTLRNRPLDDGESMSSNEGLDPTHEFRSGFVRELEQLRLQVEVMALKVDASLKSATSVLLTGDSVLAAQVVAGDNEIDDMLVSLTERCYDLLCRQSPVASDLRLVVSVLRILGDLERTGDLCLRIVKLVPDQPLLASNVETFRILRDMAYEAEELFGLALQAWASLDLGLARTLGTRDDTMDGHNRRLMRAIMKLSGEEAVPLAVHTLLAGRALERIADHSVMMGERLSYMLTGDTDSLAREVNSRRA